MANLSSILGGAWSPQPEKRVDPPDVQLHDAILAAGLRPPDVIHLDGKLHRFNSGTKGEGGHDKPGWYVAFGDGVPAGRFGCWRSGLESSWQAEIGRTLTASEEMSQTRRLSEAKTQRDAEQKKSREVAANTVDMIWSTCVGASPEHPYLKRKGIKPNGARVTGDGRLVVPLYDENGELTSLQYIDSNGGKLYHPGGATGGKFNILGSLDEPGMVYVAEGFATAATIHESTGRPCVVAYSASNLVPVVELLHKDNSQMMIVADHDASGVGQRYAEQASAKFGVKMVMPPVLGDANDYVQAGNDLALMLAPSVPSYKLNKAKVLASQPAPIKWLIKGWLQENALVMVHGPSGGGKTFVALDWLLRIASRKSDWMGHKVKPGNVVYLAGEGHHGLRSRIAGWMHKNHANDPNLWVSEAGCDLNTAEGYKKVVEAIRALGVVPDVITVDTLHRFMAGDENSAQDAKTMLDACALLMQEFGCTVILVHHTGVSDEAQHRGRGSSAWRGALDIEISIVPAKDDAPMEIVQRKAKDSEIVAPIFAKLVSFAIPEWFDEDGDPVTTALVEQAEAVEKAEKPQKESKVKVHQKTFENAWWASGCEVRNNLPYISRSALRDELLKSGRTERTVTNDLNPSYDEKLIGALILGGIIGVFEHGWNVVEPAHAGSMMMQKNQR
jgi:phage/plasmid primase-like uncharacterized protein/KaiC/GvpD/RAD55 family RecA-like ATPase